jgi:hypothetical protein
MGRSISQFSQRSARAKFATVSAVTIEDVCRAAWEATRQAASTPYDQLTAEYRARLTKRAEAVLAGEWPSGAWKAFETQVVQLADGRGNMQVGSER